MAGTAASPVVAPAAVPTAPRSLVDLVAARLDDAADRQAIVDVLAAQPSRWTWGELIAAAVALAVEFEAAGVTRGQRLVHVGRHSPDWILVDLACLLAGIVHVPLHVDAGRGEQRDWLAWLDPRAVVFSGGQLASAVSAAEIRGRIVIDLAADGSHAAYGLAGGAWRLRLGDVRGLRAEIDRRLDACDPQACATIVLSSGTTGAAHGVMHSQAALAANAAAAAEVFLDDPRDVRLSWLPLSHALARTGDFATALVRGGCLSVVRDRGRVLDACRALPPTVILGVPAFFERIERGVAVGRIPDLAAALGGAVRVCVSGGAPLRRRTAEFFAARGVPLVEGYGLAEAGPVVSLSNPRIARPGTVGPPLPGVGVRIDDRPATSGQLLVRTPSRAIGVLLPPSSRVDGHGSSAMPTTDEWLATGDLARIDEAGHLVITGRLRDTLVLATGTKLPPAAVEAALSEDDAVAQVCVVGDGLRRPVALVVPEPGVLRKALSRMGVVVVSRRQALGHPRIQRWLARRLARRVAGLPRAWRPGRYELVGRAFDSAHGEATESLKLKRSAIATAWAGTIAAAGRELDRQEVAMTQTARSETAVSWLQSALWQEGDGGFAAAAARGAEPVPDRVAAVLERATAEIDRLRAEGRLYDPLPGPPPPRPPLDDPPPAPFGRFSAEAEARLGDAGLWGLVVPGSHGGSGGSLLDLARAITRLAADAPTAAGMLAVHSSIGAVSAITGFGSGSQRDRWLPPLAQGRPLSIFAATEPDAGCDLGRIAAVLADRDGRLVLSGTKMFITGATHGRLVKLVALRDGIPAVVLVRLPDADTAEFRLRSYELHPLKHAHNAALEFDGFEVDPADVLDPGAAGDAMRIVWHGLNRGRVTLAAQAAGTLRLLLGQAREHAGGRTTWGRPIATRQLVQGRLGRIAASVVACDALAAWAAAAIDAGQSGEWEAITAKVVASHCVRDAAIDALGVHGGRAFLVGHPLGDSLHDHFAVSVYEGESDLLGLALFKGIAKHHPLAGLMREPAAARRAAAWLAWRVATMARSIRRPDVGILDAELRGHAAAARRLLGCMAVRIERAILRHGRGLAERQLEIAALSAAVRDAVSVLAVAHHADATGDDRLLPPAHAWCRTALARAAGRTLSAADHARVAAAGDSLARKA